MEKSFKAVDRLMPEQETHRRDPIWQFHRDNPDVQPDYILGVRFRVVCIPCRYIFYTLMGLRRHEINDHDQIPRTKCFECNKEFPNTHHLRIHFQKKHYRRVRTIIQIQPLHPPRPRISRWQRFRNFCRNVGTRIRRFFSYCWNSIHNDFLLCLGCPAL